MKKNIAQACGAQTKNNTTKQIWICRNFPLSKKFIPTVQYILASYTNWTLFSAHFMWYDIKIRVSCWPILGTNLHHHDNYLTLTAGDGREWRDRCPRNERRGHGIIIHMLYICSSHLTFFHLLNSTIILKNKLDTVILLPVYDYCVMHALCVHMWNTKITTH